MALEADALHLKTDVYTSLGVGVGILLIKLIGIAVLDPIVAILVAALILKEAWKLKELLVSSAIDSKIIISLKQENQEILNILTSI